MLHLIKFFNFFEVFSKISIQKLAFFFLVSGVFYLLPKNIYIKLEFTQKIKPCAKIIFWVCFLLILYRIYNSIIVKIKLNNDLKNDLKNLTIEEKQILCEYIGQETKTQYFALSDGVVQGLANKSIIYRATNVSRNIPFKAQSRIAYNINPQVYNYLQNNRRKKNFIKNIPKDQDGYILRYNNDSIY